MSTYSRVRASGFPNGAAVPALHHLRARHPEAEHEAALREVVEGEGVHRARRSGCAAEICTIDVPRRMVEVCDPHHASGPNASLPQDSAVNTVSNPSRSASRIRSRASVGGLRAPVPERQSELHAGDSLVGRTSPAP